MQTMKCKPFDTDLEGEYQDYLEGVRRGHIFGATGPDSDDSGLLIMDLVLVELLGKKPLRETTRQFLSFAIRAIIEGEDGRKAFGLNSPPGRKPSFELAAQVDAYVSKIISTGISKNKAIQAAAEHFHKDQRHIQRLLKKNDTN